MVIHTQILSEFSPTIQVRNISLILLTYDWSFYYKFVFFIADARSVAFVSPSVTPWLHEGGVNPSLRLYHYASEGIKDYWYWSLVTPYRFKQVSNSLLCIMQAILFQFDWQRSTNASKMAIAVPSYQGVRRNRSESNQYVGHLPGNDGWSHRLWPIVNIFNC